MPTHNLTSIAYEFREGTRWGRWTATGQVIPGHRGNPCALVRCDCGRITTHITCERLRKGLSVECLHCSGRRSVRKRKGGAMERIAAAMLKEAQEAQETGLADQPPTETGQSAHDALPEPPESVTAPSRPVTRGDCKDGPRPCPWASCRYNLLPDWADDEGETPLFTLRHTCALDVADGAVDGFVNAYHSTKSPGSFKSIAEVLNLTKQRVEQIEAEAKRRVLELAAQKGLETYHPLDFQGRSKYRAGDY